MKILINAYCSIEILDTADFCDHDTIRKREKYCNNANKSTIVEFMLHEDLMLMPYPLD